MEQNVDFEGRGEREVGLGGENRWDKIGIFDNFINSARLGKIALRRMKNLLDNLSENMTAEEILKAEKEIESLRKMLKNFFEWPRGDWEKIGTDMDQIDPSAADTGRIGEDIWLRGGCDKLDELKQRIKKAEEMVRRSKENLGKKPA